MLQDLNARSREIFRQIVETYCETGEAIGSMSLARRSGMGLSSASIRAIMAQLETMGLLYSPHTSAGRMPTELGIKLFVDGLMQVGGLDAREQETLQAQFSRAEQDMPRLLEKAVSALTGLTKCAGLVVAPKVDATLKHIEFISLGPRQALVILVTEGGLVENRVIQIPEGVPPSSLVEAGNYLNARLMGRSMKGARHDILEEMKQHKEILNALTQKVVEEGLGVWQQDDDLGHLIIKGQANLLGDIQQVEDLERLKILFEELEVKENLLRLLDASIEGEGVKIYIGSDNNLFSLSGCSLVVSPYHGKNDQVIGAIGVIGPKHLPYARIIPMVDYTAKMIGNLLDKTYG